MIRLFDFLPNNSNTRREVNSIFFEVTSILERTLILLWLSHWTPAERGGYTSLMLLYRIVQTLT